MKVVKPSWVHHEDHPIFSIDVHPDSSRFATGGQGQDSGIIIIWNMEPIVRKDIEDDKSVPKKLCQMDHHISCVNVVRWSHNGLFLASGSDDKLIMIWHFVQGASYDNIENWKCGHTLRGHSGDVLDLAWSAKDQYLATCSVDNTIIIWNALKFPDIITKINAHAGLVKGVAWDPVGHYFASQSDDKTLKIWKTLDWTMEKSIDEPFKQCGGTTHVLRLNWSPDGQLIISAHAINNGAPTAQVIERSNKWNTKLDFVGHRKAVTTVRFFPKILKPYESKDDNSKNYKTHCLCALGSRDRSISIWLTSYSRALCVIHDIFDNPIMDLTWSHKQTNPGLLACSMDGTIAYAEFNYDEVGFPLSREETEELFMKKYNYNINADIPIRNQQLNTSNNYHTNAMNVNKKINESASVKLIENIEILMAQEQKEVKDQKQQQQQQQNSNNNNSIASNENSLLMNTSLSNTPSSRLSLLTENHKQIERRMPDGRRRITPICVAKPGEYDAPKPFVSTVNTGFSSLFEITHKNATEQSTIIVEKRDEKNEIVEISPVKSIVYVRGSSAAGSSSQPPIFQNTNSSNSCDQQNKPTPMQVDIKQVNNQQKSPPIAAQQITQLIQQPNQPQQQQQQQHPPARKQLIKESNQNSPSSNSQSNKQQPSLKNVNQSSNNNANAKTSQQQPNIHTKQKQQVQQNLNSIKTDGKQPLQTAKLTTPAKMDGNKIPIGNNESFDQHHHQSHQHHQNYQHHKIKQQYLNPLKIDENFSNRIIRGTGNSMEIHNSIQIVEKPISAFAQSNDSIDCQISCIKYMSDKQVKWQTYFYSRVCDVAINNNIVACVCEDATLFLIRPKNGTQLCCPIQLESRVAALKLNSIYCMCLTVNGFVYVWKLNNQNQQVTKSQCSDLIDENYFNLATVINCQSCEFILRDVKTNGDFSNVNISETGTPVITMSKNRSYFFSLQTQCWHLIPTVGNLVGQQGQLLINSKSVFAQNGLGLDAEFGQLSIIQSHNRSSSLVKTIDLINKSSNSLISKEDFTLTHLESQLNASIGLSSAKEYKFWLMTYARYLVDNDYEDKLTELCNFLLGPTYSTSWNSNILTFKKRDLLTEILTTIVAQNLKFQRFYTNYNKQLNTLNSMSSTLDSVMDRLTSATAFT